jgi:hypothetical protein
MDTGPSKQQRGDDVAITRSAAADPAPPVSVDELIEWSFPASDPPATWTWDPGSHRPE